MKRKRGERADDVEDGGTPVKKNARKDPRLPKHGGVDGGGDGEFQTPTKPRRGRPPGSGKKEHPLSNGSHQPSGRSTPISKGKGKLLFTNPSKTRDEENNDDNDTPQPIVRNADRSARRKSARALIERNITDQLSDEDEFGKEDTLARKIWDDELAGGEDQFGSEQGDEEDEFDGELTGHVTPSKKARKRARRKRSR